MSRSRIKRLTNKEMLELLKKIKKGDKAAKEILWIEFLKRGLAQIKKIIRERNLYSTLKLDDGDLMTIVYLSFEKSIKKFKLKTDNFTPEVKSFSNYFYLINNYTFIDEAKKMSGWADIINWKEVVKKEKESISIQNNNDEEIRRKAEKKLLLESIKKFLYNKNPMYEKIFCLKLQGYKNEEIRKITGFSYEQFKSRLQYIKEIVREFVQRESFYIFDK